MPVRSTRPLAVATVLYIAVAVTAVSVVPHQVLALAPAPLSAISSRAAPWLPARTYDFITLFAVANTVLINYIMGSRLLYGMARQQLLPAVLGRVHPRRHTPHIAIFTLLALVLVLALSGGDDAVKQLASATDTAKYLASLAPDSRRYRNVKTALARYRDVEKQGGWPAVSKGPTLKPGMTSARVVEVRKRLAVTGELGPEIVAIGPYWTEDGQTEIDAVALAGRSRRPVLAGEAKWARSASAPRLLADLTPKVARLPGAGDDLRYVLCARDAVRDVPEGVLACTATDIFAGA